MHHARSFPRYTWPTWYVDPLRSAAPTDSLPQPACWKSSCGDQVQQALENPDVVLGLPEGFRKPPWWSSQAKVEPPFVAWIDRRTFGKESPQKERIRKQDCGRRCVQVDSILDKLRHRHVSVDANTSARSTILSGMVQAQVVGPHADRQFRGYRLLRYKPEKDERGKVEALVSIKSGVCDVLLLCTRFEYRRKRYATTLMGILTQFCREAGVHQVVAGVSDANAMKFWMSLGFRRSGRVRRDVVHFGKATLVTLNLR